MKWLTQWAITSGALILIVLAVRYCFRDKLSARLRYALWGIVLLRLLVPFQIELPASISPPVLASNLTPEAEAWDTMLYAIPTRTYHDNWMQPGEDTIISRTWHSDADGREYYGGGVVIEPGVTTRYLMMMPLGELLFKLWKIGLELFLLSIGLSNLCFSLRLWKYRRRLESADAPIPVYTAADLPSPCLFGVFRPAVYVTPEAAEHPDALRHVLAHELTHYTHKDHIWSLLRCLALALHWYNPLVWLAVVLSKRDGELACDEGAVAWLGEGERIPYGRTLVDMVAARSLRPVDLLSCSTAMTGGKKSIQQRVARLVKKPETVKTALFAAAAVVILAVVFVFAGRSEGGTMDALLRFLDQTTEIHYTPPIYSSLIYPVPITDEDLLAQAKEVLSGFRSLDSGDPQPDLNGAIDRSRIVLTSAGGEANYSLLWQNGCTYLFEGDIWRQCQDLKEKGEDIQLENISGACISEPGDKVNIALQELCQQQFQRIWAEQTGAELDCNRFLAQVDSAVSIQLSLPAYFSRLSPGPITDEALLALCRERLSGFEPMGEDWIGPDRPKLIDAYKITLSDGETEAVYALIVGSDERTYLYHWDDIDAGFDSESEMPEAIARVSSNVVNSLDSYGQMQEERTKDPNYFVPMTQEEYQTYTPEFLREKGITQLQGWSGRLEDAQFYTVGYKARDYIQLRYTGDETHAGQWVLTLIKLPSLDSNHPFDPDEIPIGYTVLTDQPAEVFAAEWYAGRLEGDALFYDMMMPAMCAARLRPEDVVSVTAGSYDPGQTIDLDVPALKEQLLPALYHQFEAEYEEEPYGTYTITLWLEDKGDSYLGHELADDANRLNLSAGSEPDVVCLWKTAFAANNAPNYTFVRSPELYRTIRNIFD